MRHRKWTPIDYGSGVNFLWGSIFYYMYNIMVNSHEISINIFLVSISVNIKNSDILIHYAYAYSSQLSGDTWFAMIWVRTLAPLRDNM